MERNNYKSIVLVFILLISSLAVIAQEKRDSLSVEDAIICVDGTIIYGKVTEVNQTDIKYRMSDIRDGAVITMPRDQVYTIAYSNHTSQIITLKSDTTVTKEKTKEEIATVDYAEKSDTANNFSYNISHGSLRIGIGFSNEYTSFRGIDAYNSTATTPSFYAAYQFYFNKWLKTGINFGYASLSYNLEEGSDYDGMSLTQNVKESITTLGVFGRYDILKGFVKPYLLAGLNFNYSSAVVEGDLYFTENGKHILSTSNLNGFKANFVARAGLDLMITKRFGVFSDIGTGSTLLQVGVIFSVK